MWRLCHVGLSFVLRPFPERPMHKDRSASAGLGVEVARCLGRSLARPTRLLLIIMLAKPKRHRLPEAARHVSPEMRPANGQALHATQPRACGAAFVLMGAAQVARLLAWRAGLAHGVRSGQGLL